MVTDTTGDTRTAFDYRLTIDPFVIAQGTVAFKALTPERRRVIRYRETRSVPAVMAEMCFPAGFEWWGCLVQLLPDRVPRPGAAELKLDVQGSRMDLSESGGLRLSLHLQPAGGETELYERDWRTMPLFECPERTIWPGEEAVLR